LLHLQFHQLVTNVMQFVVNFNAIHSVHRGNGDWHTL
jgi:hypothetical protein